MAGQDVRIKSSPEGEFGAYLAAPASGRGPGLVVIQGDLRRQQGDARPRRRVRGARLFALCPDLFWRLEPGVQLTDRTEAEWNQAFDLMNRFDPDAGIKDIQSSIGYLRHSVTGCTGKVGAVGYCLGGLLAYLAAARTGRGCLGRLLRREHPGEARRGRQDQEAADAAHRGEGRIHAARGRRRRSSRG